MGLDSDTVDILKCHRRRQIAPILDGLVLIYPDSRPLRPDYISELFLR